MHHRLRQKTQNQAGLENWGKVIQWAYLYKEGITYSDTLAYEVLEYVYDDLKRGPDYIGKAISFEKYKEMIFDHFPALKNPESFDRIVVEHFFDSVPRHFFAQAVAFEYDGVLYHHDADHAVRELFREIFGKDLELRKFNQLYDEVFRKNHEIRQRRHRVMIGEGTFEAYLNRLNELFSEQTGVKGEVSPDAYNQALSAGERLMPGAQELVRQLQQTGIRIARPIDHRDERTT